MDVTGSRIDIFSSLVSKEDQQHQKQDKQMMAHINEKLQRPSWLKGNNSVHSSLVASEAHKDDFGADKENADPRRPFKKIFNYSEQPRAKQSCSPTKDSPSRQNWRQKTGGLCELNKLMEFSNSEPEMAICKGPPSPEIKEDGFEISEDLVLDGGDEDMSPVTSSTNNALSDSPGIGGNGMLTSESPMIVSSLLSRRITFEVSHELNLLNEDNGASPMFNLRDNQGQCNTNTKIQPLCGSNNSAQERRKLDFGTVLTQSGANSNLGHGSSRTWGEYLGGTHGTFRRCTSMTEQRQSPPIASSSYMFKPPEDFTSPISRSNSGVQSSGFKRPMAIRRPSTYATSTANQASCLVKNKESQDIEIEDESVATSVSDRFHEQNLRNDGSSKRPRWDMPRSRPQLLKSQSMSAIREESPSIDKENSQSTALLSKGRKGMRRSRLIRSQSVMDPAAAAQIMEACSLAEFDPNRTADTRRQLSLPVVQGSGKNQDLKNIDCHTMAKVLNGEYCGTVSRCRIIDARYCYEFEGGHIRGAGNYGAWDEDAFLAEFFPASLGAKTLSPRQKSAGELNVDGGNDESQENKREILVFHCEFSSARGPALMRLLRKKDREINKATYPALHYPECYLLHDGYKAFYETYPHLCDPQSYVAMKHPSFRSEERRFHKKSKSWTAGGCNTVSRTGASSRLLKL